MEQRHFHRRNLPHLYYDEGIYFVTFRLADSLSIKVIETLHDELKNSKEELNIKQKKIFQKYDSLLHSSTNGKHYLQNPIIAKEIEDTIKYWEGIEYEIVAYCIMPNHVHFIFKLLKQNRGMSKILQSIKRISAARSNKILNRSGTFWQHESFDRLVRNERELFFEIQYVITNPVEAGLVSNWKDYPFSYFNPFYF